MNNSPTSGMRLDGYLYFDDNGWGPFYTESEEYANRYLAAWPVFRYDPPHDGPCVRKNEKGETTAYGICLLCEQHSKKENAP